MKSTRYYARGFLNSEEHGGTAFIEATVEPVHKSGDVKSFGASLKLSDCSRIIDLEFGVYSAEDVDNVRQKLARLRRAVLKFDRVVNAQLDEVEGR